MTILKLIAKDMAVIKSQTTLIFILPLVIILIAGSGNQAILSTYFPMVLIMLVIGQGVSTLESDSICGWDKLAATMPITILAEVASKYLLLLFLSLLALVMALIVDCGFWILGKLSSALITPGLTSAFLFSVAYGLVSLPAIYRLGASKSRVVFLTAVSLVVLVPTTLTTLGVSTDDIIRHSSMFFSPATVALILAVASGISFLLSYRFRQRRRFHRP